MEQDAAEPATASGAEGPGSTSAWEPPLELLLAPSVPLGPLRPRGQTRHWVAHVIKGLLVAIEVPLLLVLAMSAGLIQVLPSTPPAADVVANGHTARTAPTSFCWFTPGHGTCADAATRPLSAITSARGAPITVRLDHPAPTACTVTATASGAAPNTPIPLRAQSSAHATYTFEAPAPDGTYALDVRCQWASNPALRWWQGQGDADYSLALRVDG